MKTYEKKIVFRDFFWWWIIIASTFCYRAFLIKDYCSKYVDDDQALLWFGTTMAAHFEIHEPHFLGQIYGSMLESICAVPFYWIGIPFQYCMPITTCALWYLPFLISAFWVKRKSKMAASIILLTPLLFRWDYDLLTSIPRSFICGFFLAFCGIILLLYIIEEDTGLNKFTFLVPVLLFEGYIQTETTITVSALGLMFILLYHYREIIREWKQLLFGSVIGWILLKWSNQLFYEANPE